MSDADKHGAGLALPLAAIEVSTPGSWDFGWCVVDSNKRVIGYCMTEAQAKQLAAPFAVTETPPTAEAVERFPGNVTITRALLAEAYRGLKRHYEMPEVRREIDRLLSAPAEVDAPVAWWLTGDPAQEDCLFFSEKWARDSFEGRQRRGGKQHLKPLYAAPPSATDAIPDVRLDGDGMLDEICADNVHLERLDRNYWFLSVSGGGKKVAAWLSSSPTFEWREGSPRSEAEPTADARDAARWRWLVSRIDYRDKMLGTGSLEMLVREWVHQTRDMTSDSITVAVDTAMRQADGPHGGGQNG